MGGKRKAQPAENAQVKAAASGDVAVAHGRASQKRQTHVLSVDVAAAGSAEAGGVRTRAGRRSGSSRQAESASTWAPATMRLSMRCDPSAMAGRKAALEAALRNVMTEFGGWECRVEWVKVGPSEDTLQQVLPLLLAHVQPEGATQFFQVCNPWRRELEARGFCNRTAQLCSALAESGDFMNFVRIRQNVLRRLRRSPGDAAAREHVTFLEKLEAISEENGGEPMEWSLLEWLQSASQEPDSSFLSRGAVLTARGLGLPLVRWIGKPQGGSPESLTLAGHRYYVSSVAFSSDGKRVVSASGDGFVKIWNVETGAEVCSMTGHSQGVLSVAFSPDGRRVVSCSDDKLVKIWDAATGAEIFSLGHSGVRVVIFSPDGTRVASFGSQEGLVKIWDAATGTEVCTLRCHLGRVSSVSFSADGKRIVSGAIDSLVKIWDVETGSKVVTIGHSCTGRCICTTKDTYPYVVHNPECVVLGHTASVSSVDFSPDGKRVVSGSDKLVKIWHAETGAEVRTLRGHSQCVGQVAFSPDGAQVFTGSGDCTVRFWHVGSGLQTHQLAGRRFTLVEGPSHGRKRVRHILTELDDTLRIYQVANERQHVEYGGTDSPLACFKAPQQMKAVRCHGAGICVGCHDGAVCMLSAPFLIA